MRRTGRLLRAGVTALAFGVLPAAALAETLTGALAKAYEFAPTLNAVRAAQRALDEGVAIARSDYRPNITAQGDYGISASPAISGATGGPDISATISLQQRLFDGFQRQNAVKGAKAAVFAGQEDLRASEQDTLLAAVQAYVAVLRDQRIVEFRRENIAFLNEQLNAAQARFEVGEGTRTDVAQARAERAAALAELEAAQANVASSEALYVQIIGSSPDDLRRASVPDALLPHGLNEALTLAQAAHPDIRSAQFDVESSAFNVKEQEGTFLPSLDVRATASTVRGPQQRAQGIGFQESYTVGANLSVPLYRGGAGSAQVRQAKEGLSAARIRVDEARRGVRQGVVSAFSSYRAALANRSSIGSQIAAARLAVEGLIEERNVGQRTTLDVLLGQQTLIQAQVLEAQNDALLVSTSYQLVSSVGSLTARKLGLHVTYHDPDEHYLAVKDKWYGLRTPDQR